MRAAVRVLAIAFIAAPLLAQPQRTFVSAKSGDDTNPCSLASPCRTLQRGVNVVASGGEVIPLDSGGYGTLIIQKPVAVTAPAGVHVGITSTSPSQQYALDVFTTGSVTLRGITVSNMGGWGGIYDQGGGTLRIESCHVDHALYAGINLYAGYGLSGGTLIITDTTVTASAQDGIETTGTDPGHHALVSIERVRISGNGGVGIASWGNSDATVRNSVISNNGAGVQTITATSTDIARMTVLDCAIDGNADGVLSDPPFGSPDAGIMRVGNSVIAHSTSHGIWIRNGRIYSEGNNTVTGNASAETFPDSFTTK